MQLLHTLHVALTSGNTAPVVAVLLRAESMAEVLTPRVECVFMALTANSKFEVAVLATSIQIVTLLECWIS